MESSRERLLFNERNERDFETYDNKNFFHERYYPKFNLEDRNYNKTIISNNYSGVDTTKRSLDNRFNNFEDPQRSFEYVRSSRNNYTAIGGNEKGSRRFSSLDRNSYSNKQEYDDIFEHENEQFLRTDVKTGIDKEKSIRTNFVKPRRRNGFVYEDIYSDYDEAQGSLSLLRPIKPEFLNLPSSYNTKFNSLPRNYSYTTENRGSKQDYHGYRIRDEKIPDKKPEKRILPLTKTRSDAKNVAVCKPMRVANKSKYWTTTEPSKKTVKTDSEPKKYVKFSEVSGCRKTIVNDPVLGKKVVPVRELEVSLDQLIENGYFEKLNIPILKPVEVKIGNAASGELGGVGRTKLITGGRAATSRKKPRHLPQVLAALAVSLAPFSAGLGKGYSSPAIASLQGTGNGTRRDFQLSDQQASWLASLSFLGALFGGMAGGAAMRHGRRRVLALAAVPFSVSWLLTVAAASVEVMCLSSLMGGFCTSILTMLSQVYISEISVPDIRGCLSALLKIVGHLGVLFSFTIGAYLDWQQLALFISAAPLLLFCTVLYIPETPSYLVLIGKDEEAYKSLLWLRGPESDVVQELATIRTNVLASKNYSHRHITGPHFSNIDARTMHRLLGPVLVTCGLMLFQRFSGAHAFSFYAVPIFRKTFGGMNPHGAAIAVSFVQLLASCLSGLLIDTVGRLPLLIVSSVLMSMALAGFGSYAYYEEVHRNQRIQSVMFQSLGQNDWIPLLCVLVFTVAFSLGMSPISWLLIGELFPLEFRAFGSAMATAFSYLCAFVGVKTFVDFQQALGLHGAFWLYASISVGGLCFVVCCVPETKGRDLDEMDPNYVQNLSPKR